jgi:hypothetical protein
MGYVRETTGCVRKVIGGYVQFEKKKFPTPFDVQTAGNRARLGQSGTGDGPVKPKM